jgi:hypothetical protein
VNGKLVLITAAVLIGIFGLGWLIMPNVTGTIGGLTRATTSTTWAAAMRLYARAGCGLVVGAYCAQYAGAPRPDDRRLGRPSANHRYQSVPRAGAERLAYRCC